jgi:hypothetical protein
MYYLHSTQRFAILWSLAVTVFYATVETLKGMLAATVYRNHEPSTVQTMCSFLQHIPYIPPQTNNSRRQELVSALEEALLSWRILPGDNSSSIYQICKHSAAMAEVRFFVAFT